MDDRLVNLEMKVAFLEKNIEDLDEVIRGLSDELVAMGRRLASIESEPEVEES